MDFSAQPRDTSGRWTHGGPLLEVFFDDRNMQAGLARLLERVSDPRPALREIGERMVASTIHNFETETAPDGTKWAPLSEKYRDDKSRGGLSTMILQRSGRLKNSIHPVVSRNEVRIGTNVRTKTGFPYPIVHQLGTSNAGRKKNTVIPKREFLGMGHGDAEAVLGIIAGYLGR
jgi:phage virion morphogenesis protein